MAGALAYDGPFWASSSRAVPVALAGGAMGLINALGNLGGFVGPYVGGWLQDASGGSFLSTAVVLAVALVLGGLVMLTLRRQADKPPRARAGSRRCVTPAPDCRLTAGRSSPRPVTASWGSEHPEKARHALLGMAARRIIASLAYANQPVTLEGELVARPWPPVAVPVGCGGGLTGGTTARRDWRDGQLGAGEPATCS